MLSALDAEFDWPFNMNAAAQQARLAVDLMTSERAIAATDTEIHVHDEEVRTIDDAGSNLCSAAAIGRRSGTVSIVGGK